MRDPGNIGATFRGNVMNKLQTEGTETTQLSITQIVPKQEKKASVAKLSATI